MGGCRCCFRNCQVASERNRGMHFFKFPIKHKERFKQWTKLAGVEQFLECRETELINKVICARHFPDTHFMNYKRNRLTISALPSLHRLNEEHALDYSNNSNKPTLIKLAEVTKPHLIPPIGFPCPMIFTAADRKIAEEIIKTYDANTESQLPNTLSANIQSNRSCRSRTMQEAKKPKLDKNNSTEDNCIVYYELEKNAIKKKQLLVNDDTYEFISFSDNENEVNQSTLPEEPAVNNAPENANSVEYFDEKVLFVSEEDRSLTKTTSHTHEKNCDGYLENIKDELTNEMEKLERTKQDLNRANEKIADLSSKLREFSEKNKQLEDKLHTSETQNAALNNQLLVLQSENEALEEHGKRLETQYMDICKQKQQEQFSPSNPKQQISLANQNQPLTKVQLFNGVKKYLSQMMVALLRMQLSSGSEEREWKPDERRLAVDLMGLGEEVYKYFTDEWVIRLPPIRQVRQWQTEVCAVDDEDDI